MRTHDRTSVNIWCLNFLVDMSPLRDLPVCRLCPTQMYLHIDVAPLSVGSVEMF